MIDTAVNTITTMGLLAEGVYITDPEDTYFEKNKIVSVGDSSFLVIDHTDVSNDGFNAVLLQNEDTKEFVIVFRGTQEIIDWDSNITTFLSNYNPQADEGLEFVENMIQAYQIDVNNLTLTGHSLGGIIAQFVSAELRTQAYTYNSFGANLLSSLPPFGVPFYSVIGQKINGVRLD